MRKTILTSAALLAAVLTSSATVSVQGWWHFGDVADYYADSVGGHRFANAFSRVGSGNAGAGIMPFGCGGPLDNTGFTSANCLYWTPTHADAAGMWNATGYNPPPNNYVIECWCQPEWPGTRGGNGSWLFCSGSSGGVAFVLTNDNVSTMAIRAMIVGNGVTIGDPLVVDTTRWAHLAIVNSNGVQTFYVNGVQHGAPDIANATVPAGEMYAGSAPGTQPTYCGYLDEGRISTFTAGAFSTNDLLLRPTGPNLLVQPQSVIVWNGGAAPFAVTAASDTVTGYQWQSNSTNIPGATSESVVLPQLFIADSGTAVRCILNGSGISVTSAVATATVLAPNSANVAAYRNLVTAEPSLLAYFPADGCTGSTVTNVADATRLHDGTLEPNANYDSRTNRAFAQRALGFNLSGDVNAPMNGDVAIPNNPAFEFSNGNGTIEALVFLSRTTPADATVFSEATDYGSSVYYAFRVSKDGTSLVYANDSGVALSWVAPANLVGQWTHVALVIDHTNNVTAYANGFNLGTKTQTSFGNPGSMAPAWIGSSGLNDPGSNFWAGTIDELAVYGAALPAETIAIHSGKFQSGTNQIPATITGAPATGSKTLLTGGSASFMVTASGSPPLSYLWTRDGSPIAGATKSILTLSPTTSEMSGTYGVTVANPYATNSSSTFILTFVAPGDTYAAKVMNDNPSAFWRLDETSGTNGAPAVDQAGGHDGTYIVATAPGYYSTNGLLPAVADTAVRFVAANPADGSDYARVEVPYSPALNPSGPFSVECFCIPFYDGNDSGGYLVSSQNRPTNVRQGWMLGASANSVEFDFFLCDGSTTFRQVNSSEHCSPNVLVHDVAVYDGTNAYIYINGELSGTWTPSVFVPNPGAPLEIACRNGNYLGFDGVIDEVAFYGYALSANQISNHWSSLFAKAAITSQPVGATNVEGSTITLSAAASGYVNSYQWFKGGASLVNQLNPDGTQHYPQDVINPTLVIARAVPSDSGLYFLAVSNTVPGGAASTIPVNVLITNDMTPPKVVSVTALATPNAPPNPAGPSPYLVKVLFSKRIDPFAGTYAIAGTTVNSFMVPGTAAAAPLGGDWQEALVYTTGLTPGQSYTLNVSGVQDQTVSQNPLVATNVTFRAPVMSQGLVVWDYYYLGSTTGNGVVSDLTGNPYYPNAPMTNLWSSSFDSTPITGGDINNVPPFGALGDRYGCSLSGWITPAVTTNYYFFIASDDASELDLSSNDNPENVNSIATCSQYTAAFAEPGAENTSALQPLVAGQKYFVRALQVEGSGGDFVKVAWRMEGDTTPAASLRPIPGTYLSSYAAQPAVFDPPIFSDGQLTISWTGTGTLLESTNVALPLNQWPQVPGNPASPYQVTPAAGVPHMFYRLVQ